MFRLSKKSDYALMAMKHIAVHDAVNSMSAREIAGQFDIPLELMAKVLQRLTRRGLLISQKGTRGGYHLARPAEKISVGDVIQAIDGPVTVTACSPQVDTCDQYSKCNVRDPLWRVKDRIVDTLHTFTISELASDSDSDSESLTPMLVSRRSSSARITLLRTPEFDAVAYLYGLSCHDTH